MGVIAEISFIVSTEICALENPSSFAKANRCSTELELAPIAMSILSAFLSASGVRISRGRMFFSYRCITASPVRLASASLAEYTDGIVPLPGSAMPSASKRQFMEFAVNMPEQEPLDGQAAHS